MLQSKRELHARGAKRDLGKQLLQSVREMKAGHRGCVHKVKLPPIVEYDLCPTNPRKVMCSNLSWHLA